MESIVTLEDSHAVEEADMPTPSRASVAAEGSSTPQPSGGSGRGGRPPRPADIDDALCERGGRVAIRDSVCIEQ